MDGSFWLIIFQILMVLSTLVLLLFSGLSLFYLFKPDYNKKLAELTPHAVKYSLFHGDDIEQAYNTAVDYLLEVVFPNRVGQREKYRKLAQLHVASYLNTYR